MARVRSPSHAVAALAWFRRLGCRFSASSRRDIEVLADGQARVGIYFPSFGEAIALVELIDALAEMHAEDTAARAT